MGLAAPRKKTKISHDPNNTNWSRSTTGFGHKILSSQGWTPGSFLGARNAAHAKMFTAASASHIRVVMKDDTLGLGARSKRDPLNEPTGLDAFKGLLGRLNGKSDAELQAHQRKRDDVKLARYAATKWQAVRFISGGLLTQEKDDRLSKEAQNPLADAQEASHHISEKRPKESANDKTRTIDQSEVSESCERQAKKAKDRNRKEKMEKKDKAEKKGKKGKQEKKGREKKRKRAEQLEASEDSSSREPSSERDAHTSNQQDQPSVKERRPPGRQMLRGRHIAQKRRAVMDEKSLNEIFMIKS